MAGNKKNLSDKVENAISQNLGDLLKGGNVIDEGESSEDDKFSALEKLDAATDDDASFEETGSGEGRFEPPIRGEVPSLATGSLMQGATSALERALGHKEDAPTGMSGIKHGDGVIYQQATVRDKPNALYRGRNPKTGEYFYKRKQADMLLEGLFGKASNRVYALAAQAGFVEKPMMAVSQFLDHQLQTDAAFSLSDINAKSPEIFEDCKAPYEPPTGTLLKALNMCFAGTTVRALAKRAEYADASVVATLRGIIWNLCDKMNVQGDARPAEQTVS